MTAFNQHRVAGESTSRGMGLRWNPPPVPVLLRIPRIVEAAEIRPNVHVRRAVPAQRREFRGRVGIGVGILMLLAAIPWLIRWHPSTDGPLEASAPVAVMEPDSDSEILPPLYAQTAVNPSAFLPNHESENDSAAELVESLTVPHPVGVRQ